MQSSALRQFRSEGSRYHSGMFKGSPKQAVCPFCYKVFYDKSTMNRHVSKRVCLGLQFQASDFTDEVEMISEMVPLPSISSPICPSSPLSYADLSPEFSMADETSKTFQESPKSNKIPCPYCKKLMKGEKGVRKHLDFYGCPMAFSTKVMKNEHE